MAKIPIYQSSEKLITEPPTARESPQLAGQAGRELQAVGEAITQAHDVIRKAYDLQQTGTAKLKTLEGVETIEQKAIADGENTYDLTPYESDLQRLKADTLKGITNPAVRRQFELDFDLQAAQTRTKIKSIFWNRVKEKSIANLNSTNEYFTNEYARTGDISILDAMNKNTDTYVKHGIIGADDAEKIKAKTTADGKWGYFLNRFMQNPDETMKSIDKFGFTIEEKDKALKRSTEWRREIREDQDKNAHDLTMKRLAGTLTFEEIDIREKATDKRDAISFSDADSLRTSLISQIKTDAKAISTNEEKAVQYLNLIEQFVDDNIDKAKFRQTVIKRFSDGIIDEKREAPLLLEIKQNLEDEKFYREKERIKGAFESIISFFYKRPELPQSGRTKQEVASAIRNTFNKIKQENMSPELAVQSAIEDFQKATNPNRLKYKIGDVVPLPTGDSFKITGYDTDGEPTGDIIKRASR